MSRGLSRTTRTTAYAPFTPSHSGQRSHPTSYRGCWHVVSRCFFLAYRHSSSARKGVYTPRGVLHHAASLRQACAHCGKFLAAASRRSRGRVSVPVWLVVLSDQRPVIALVGHYPANQLIGRRTLPAPLARLLGTPRKHQAHAVLPPVSRGYPPRWGRFPTCSSPVRHGRPPKGLPSDLHALGTPPALFLSQDQTLHQSPPCGGMLYWFVDPISLCRIASRGTRSRFSCQSTGDRYTSSLAALRSYPSYRRTD